MYNKTKFSRGFNAPTILAFTTLLAPVSVPPASAQAAALEEIDRVGNVALQIDNIAKATI